MNAAPTFDPAHYQAAKQKVIAGIKALHPDWAKTEGFLMDGVFCTEVYAQQRLRVLVILSESYGYAESGDKYDYVQQAIDNDIIGLREPQVKTPRRIAALLWLLLYSLDAGAPIDYDAWDWQLQVNSKTTAELQATLSRIAWINVKKVSRAEGTAQDHDEIFDSVEKYRSLLQIQLDSIAPHLILVCGNPVFWALQSSQLLSKDPMEAEKWTVQTNHLGQKFMWVTHPSYSRDWGYEAIYETFKILWASLASA